MIDTPRLPHCLQRTMLWPPKTDAEKESYFETYKWCLDHGLDFFDTAEVYGNGSVASLLREFIRRDGRAVKISSKIAPPLCMNPVAPKRKTVDTKSPEALSEALDGTLARLGVDHLGLYLMHTPPKYGTVSDYTKIMVKELERGRIKAIGVYNHNKAQIEEAAESLGEMGASLFAAMVGYEFLLQVSCFEDTDLHKKYNFITSLLLSNDEIKGQVLDIFTEEIYKSL